MKSLRAVIIVSMLICGINITSSSSIAAEISQGGDVAASSISGANNTEGNFKLDPAQQAELNQALESYPRQDFKGSYGGVTPNWNPGGGPFCLFNCPPPVGSVSASPQQVSVPKNGTGSTSLHWTWDESRAAPIGEYACLWVSAAGEQNAHMVDCEHPGNNYTVNVSWIAPVTYTFWVALGNPKGGPATVPIANLIKFAQTTVVGISQ